MTDPRQSLLEYINSSPTREERRSVETPRFMGGWAGELSRQRLGRDGSVRRRVEAKRRMNDALEPMKRLTHAESRNRREQMIDELRAGKLSIQEAGEKYGYCTPYVQMLVHPRVHSRALSKKARTDMRKWFDILFRLLRRPYLVTVDEVCMDLTDWLQWFEKNPQIDITSSGQ